MKNKNENNTDTDTHIVEINVETTIQIRFDALRRLSHLKNQFAKRCTHLSLIHICAVCPHK